jgi:hypothetical protein
MVSSIQDTPYIDTPGNHLELSPSQHLQRSFDFKDQIHATTQAHSPNHPVGTNPDAPFKSPPGLDRNVADLRLPEKKLTSTTTALENSDQLLLDTQISTNSKLVIHEIAIPVLDSDKSLPDTQAGVPDRKRPWETPNATSDSQLLETQISELQNISKDESVRVHPRRLLTYSQSNAARLESPIPALAIPDIPNPQINPAANEDILLLDTQSSTDSLGATFSTYRTSIQNNEDLPNTEVSWGDQPGPYRSTQESSLRTCINGAASAPPTTSSSILNDKDLPDTQALSVSKLGSSTSIQQSALKICLDVTAHSMQSFPSKQPLNKRTCRERKRIIVSPNRPPALTKVMCQWIDKTNYLLDPFREDDECWFHPSPPSGHLSMNGILRPCGKLQRRFNWKDRNGQHSLVLNFGIVSKLINYKMTKQQKDGFINKQWHLSRKLLGDTARLIWSCFMEISLSPRE